MPSAVAKARTTLFIKNYGKDIAKAILNTGLYFEAVVGQKCGESAYGTSSLAANYNNFGGIMGKTQEAVGKTSNGWAIFATPFDCFRSYARFLNTPRYINAGVFSAPSPEEQIIRIVKAGYCAMDAATPTPQAYVKKCQGAIDSARIVCPLGKISNLYAALDKLKPTTG